MLNQSAWTVGKKLLIATTALVLVAGPTVAAAQGLYIGAHYGWFTAKDGDWEDDSSNGYRVSFGGTAGRIIGWEIGYAQMNEIRSRSLGDIDINTWDANLLAGIPIGPVAIFAKVGGAYVDVSAPNRSGETDWTYKYGVGIDLNLGKNFAVRAEWNRTPIDVGFIDTDIDTASLGVLFRF